jgi:Flp pilus assembly protein TadG
VNKLFVIKILKDKKGSNFLEPFIILIIICIVLAIFISTAGGIVQAVNMNQAAHQIAKKIAETGQCGPTELYAYENGSFPDSTTLTVYDSSGNKLVSFTGKTDAETVTTEESLSLGFQENFSVELYSPIIIGAGRVSLVSIPIYGFAQNSCDVYSH